ncbi:MAG: MFS transporter [Phycisphaerales bacterium]|jgi:MFS transporter, SP family, arabinose:H+ symporter|nr:MFS transporter [Phycisphaerales bacterium]
MKHQRLIFWSITAALAGFLFGFDTIVISGAERQIQGLWKLSGAMHGMAIGAALWGMVLGAIFGGMPTAKYGRKKTLIWVGVLYFVSAVGSGLAPEVYTFMIARFIGGLGVGISTVVAPMFISEISPAESRGKLAGMFQFNIVFGILIALVSNYFCDQWINKDIAWRWMLGMEAFPAALYTLLAFTLPESPRWLITHAQKREDGANVFRQINPEFTDEQIETLVTEVEQTKVGTTKTHGFWSRRLRFPIMLAFLIAMFNQLSGINIVFYFAPRLLGLAGLENALGSAISLGVTNLVFTFVGLYLIDKLGRRSLLYIGSIGYILSLGVCAFAFLSNPGFKVVSDAKDLLDKTDTVLKVENKEKYLNAEDQAALYKDYKSLQVALFESSSATDYSGEEIKIPINAKPAKVIEIVEAGKADASKQLGGMSMTVLICLIGFIAAHAIGQGAVIWVFISEIFPNDHRAAGQSLGSSTHWVFAAGMATLYPMVAAKISTGYIFAFFCAMMCLQLLWVKVMVPETKGISLEEMSKELGIE